MHAAVIERVMALAEEFTVECASVEARVMLAGNTLDQRHVDSFRDFLKLLHALNVNLAVLRVVRQVAGEKHEIRPLWQGVDHVDSPFEGSCSERVGRAVEANMGIAELNEGERR